MNSQSMIIRRLTRDLERRMSRTEACLLISSVEHYDVLDVSPANYNALLNMLLETKDEARLIPHPEQN